MTEAQRPPLPPFTFESAVEKVRLAEDGWNSRDPARVALAYTVDSQWRNRAEFVTGREAIVAFLSRWGILGDGRKHAVNANAKKMANLMLAMPAFITAISVAAAQAVPMSDVTQRQDGMKTMANAGTKHLGRIDIQDSQIAR